MPDNHRTTINSDDNKQTEKLSTSIFIFTVFICFSISISFVIFSGVCFDKAKAPAIDGKININHASPASMMRLPGIGPSRAEAIVLYRQNCKEDKAFKSYKDLEKIHGIGVKTAQGVKEYITFE